MEDKRAKVAVRVDKATHAKIRELADGTPLAGVVRRLVEQEPQLDLIIKAINKLVGISENLQKQANANTVGVLCSLLKQETDAGKKDMLMPLIMERLNNEFEEAGVTEDMVRLIYENVTDSEGVAHEQ